jgi:hypothetical protein
VSNTTASLRRTIAGAADLQSVVRTMKTVAASSIGQYEKSVSALAGYYHVVELGLWVDALGAKVSDLLESWIRRTPICRGAGLPENGKSC